MPCQSIPVNGKLLAGCGKKKPSGEPGTPVSQGKEIRAGEYNGRTVSFRLPDKRRGTLSGGTDGRVPFVLPPRCPASAMQPHGMVGNGRRDGTARAPRCKRKTVKTLSPTLGIAGESPQLRRGLVTESLTVYGNAQKISVSPIMGWHCLLYLPVIIPVRPRKLWSWQGTDRLRISLRVRSVCASFE